jgi:DNA-directed RNA polymerase II subunit RPB2
MDYETYDWTVLADFFKKNGFVHHQIESFDDFIHYGIERTMAEEPSITVPLKDREGEHRITFNDVYIPSPTVLEEDRSLRTIFPSEARVRDLTYDSPIYVTVTETIAEEGVEPVSTTHTRVVIGRIPIMLKSKKCSLSGLTPEEIVEKGECARDPGGYFIVKGKERVIIAQIRGNYNVPMVFSQKPKNGETYEHV